MLLHIIIAAYNLEWTRKYLEGSERMKLILQDNRVAIYPIGSIAVPGLAAKPIIDMMAIVRNLKEADNVSCEFESMDYECMEEFGISGRRYLRKEGKERTHQIRILQITDIKNINRHLAFRDYLRSHIKEREG